MSSRSSTTLACRDRCIRCSPCRSGSLPRPTSPGSITNPADKNAQLDLNMPHFDQLRGGLQIKALPPASIKPDKFSASFKGWTLQLDNIRWAILGLRLYGSTLGKTVRDVFNQKFQPPPAGDDPMVPLERMELSGYGASIFSNYLDSTATIADVSQVQFDVVVGRTGHEVVQIRSILYPFGVHVVRTITLMRSNNGYVFRSDSGWKAESDGFYNFDYTLDLKAMGEKPVSNPYEFHAQPVKGVSHVREIRDFPAAGAYTSSFTLADPDLPPELQGLSLARMAAGLRRCHQQESQARRASAGRRLRRRRAPRQRDQRRCRHGARRRGPVAQDARLRPAQAVVDPDSGPGVCRSAAVPERIARGPGGLHGRHREVEAANAAIAGRRQSRHERGRQERVRERRARLPDPSAGRLVVGRAAAHRHRGREARAAAGDRAAHQAERQRELPDRPSRGRLRARVERSLRRRAIHGHAEAALRRPAVHAGRPQAQERPDLLRGRVQAAQLEGAVPERGERAGADERRAPGRDPRRRPDEDGRSHAQARHPAAAELHLPLHRRARRAANLRAVQEHRQHERSARARHRFAGRPGQAVESRALEHAHRRRPGARSRR